MPSKDGGRGSSASSPSIVDDPIVTILREHTELQPVAERFRQIADALDQGESSSGADALEGIEVHRRFLIEVHQRREAAFAAEVGPSADANVRSALAKCRAEHPLAGRFQTESRACLGKTPLSAASAHRLAELMRAEADRIVEHHRWEAETIYHAVRGKLSKEVVIRLDAAMRPLVGEAAAAQAGLVAWTSHANPTSD